jgi:hypothetical protein
MSGETDLRTLLRTMRPELGDDIYVFATLPPGHAVPAGVFPVMIFHEDEGLTLIVPESQAAAAGLNGTFPCRRVTLTVHSALNAVGFMAAIAARLAEAGIGVNPVAGFFHDHLFVPADRATDAVEILRRLATEADA